MSYHERRVEAIVDNSLHQWFQVMLHVRLSRPKRQALVHHRTHRKASQISENDLGQFQFHCIVLMGAITSTVAISFIASSMSAS